MKKNLKSTLFVLIPAILIEFYFFVKAGLKMSETFFFIWFVVFITLFSFRWVNGSASLMGIGGGSNRFLASKFSESMFNIADSEKSQKSDLGLDLVFLGIAIVNLLLSLLSYYISR